MNEDIQAVLVFIAAIIVGFGGAYLKRLLRRERDKQFTNPPSAAQPKHKSDNHSDT